MKEILKIMYFNKNDEIKYQNNSINSAPEYERPFRPASELMFSGMNKRNTYSENNIRVEYYNREGRYLYR